MKKITVLSGLLLLAGLAAQAQERVAEYNVRPAVTVRTPLQGDSVNFKGDKFTIGNLLKTKVSLNFDEGSYERMAADTAGYVAVAKADKDNLFYLFATNLRAERFMKGKLNVYSPARFEVFVTVSPSKSRRQRRTACRRSVLRLSVCVWTPKQIMRLSSSCFQARTTRCSRC